MGNIWQFLIFTLTISISAGFILIIKRILEDKLSPRWQYGVWAALVLRTFVPISIKQGVFVPLPLWIEMLKSFCEKNLVSEFSSAFVPLENAWFLPALFEIPKSVTDWFFAVYAGGVIVSLLWYAFSYVRLRVILKKGDVPSEALQEAADRVAEKYGLKMCRIVEAEGIGSAFVCGSIKPILAVPKGTVPDDKIILHELLHVKYHDALQSVLWSILRALHWCNPFMHYVFDRISNDMESLCDQRVLERLEGEERREYGVILLDMANDRYARAAGTTSISNGGKNIARRIEAIVRFKKYPRGMALVSLCIVVFTASILLSGSSYTVSQQDLMPVWENELDRSMAVVRINRCGTIPGALDTYAKGLILENGVYLAAASPLDAHDELMAEMLKSCEDGWVAYHVESGAELDYVDKDSGYTLYNVVSNGDGTYSAVIAISTYGEYDEEMGEYNSGTVLIPVTVYQNNGWVVEETGERQIFDREVNDIDLPLVNVFEVQGEYGSVTLGQSLEYEIYNTGTSGWNQDYFDEAPKLNAEFSYVMIWNRHVYDMNTKTTAAEPENYVGMEVVPLDDAEDKYEFTEIGAGKGAVSGEYSYQSEWVDGSFNGIIKTGGGGGWGSVGIDPVELPNAYAVQIVWDDVAVEEFLLA
ncbi:MAG: M56 family metallopeptidase [Oscillospiraceae bacterium]|nr:M56 family metallopeptidase [Oscillospiraceae bacterium]